MKKHVSLLIALAVSFSFYIPSAFASGSISGKVTLQSRTNHSNLITFKLKDPRQGSVKTRQVSTATDGSYSLPGITPGTYNLSAKASNFLSQNQILIEVVDEADTPGIDFNLLGGDCDNNNVVSMYDFGIFYAAYGSRIGQPRWDPRADFNGNGQIDMQDFSIWRSNYGKSGVEPKISIISPHDNSLTSLPTTYVLGIVDDNKAQVSVNGLPVAVSNRTFYASNITLTEGQNRLTAIAVNRHGIKNADLVIVVLDTAPPTVPIVTDGGEYSSSPSQLSAAWVSDDPQSGIKEYRYSLGTVPGATDILNWTSAGQNTEITLTNLNLIHNTTYYFNVRAINGVNLPSAVGSSDGIKINAHIPEITRIIPYGDSTLQVGDTVAIEATAQDLDGDPLYYQFSIDGQVRQVWSSSNILNWIVEPSASNTHTITVEVKDDKNGSASQDVTYNIQNVVIDTTPPSAPVLTTGATSSSLDSIEAQWSSEDPESGIIEYQYAIGTTPGGTDIVYWTTYGNNTQAFISGLNLTQGQAYYLSVVAKNGAGLKSSVTISPAITAQKEPYIKIYYPYQNAILTNNEIKIKGIAEGLTQITINSKPVSVNPDGTFIGPTLVPPGYARRQNITSSDPNYIIMNFPGQTTITAEGAGEKDVVSFYCYRLFIKTSLTDHVHVKDLYNRYGGWPGAGEFDNVTAGQKWNDDILVQSPFSGWASFDYNSRYKIDDGPWNYDYSDYWGFPIGDAWVKDDYYYYSPYTSQYVFSYEYERTVTRQTTIHTLPAINGEIQPMVLIFEDFQAAAPFYFPFDLEPVGVDITQHKINGQSLTMLYGEPTGQSANACYVVLRNYTPDTDLELDVTAPTYTERQYWNNGYTDTYDDYSYKCFSSGNNEMILVDVMRELPYGSGDYVPVNNLLIFQPDDGKEKAISINGTNTAQLTLKFDRDLSNSLINTVEATAIKGGKTATYNLTETAADSGLFCEPTNTFTIKLEPLTETMPSKQDEITCTVTSSDDLNGKVFNLNESASDSFYFKSVRIFATLTIENELLPYQNDSIELDYENGFSRCEVAFTETSPDSLTFTNADNSLTVKINNYTGSFPETLDINIPNNGQLQQSNPRLYLAKVGTNPYVYSNEPATEALDTEPVNPATTGAGVFKVRFGSFFPIHSQFIPKLLVTITTDLESKTLHPFKQDPYRDDGFVSYTTEPIVLLPPNSSATYDEVVCPHSSTGAGKVEISNQYGVAKLKKDVWNSAFTGQYWIEGKEEPAKKAAAVLGNELGYYTIPFDDLSGIYCALSKQQVLDNVPKYSIWFSFSHGRREQLEAGAPLSFKSFAARKDGTSSSAVPVYPQDIAGVIGNNEYNLVFLNSCYSASPKEGSNAEAFMRAFKTGAYIGWTQDSSPGTAEWAAEYFFRQCVNNKTEDATFRTNDASKLPEDRQLRCLGSNRNVDINLNHLSK